MLVSRVSGKVFVGVVKGRCQFTIQEERAGLAVTSNALQQSQRVADAVRGGSRQLRWVEEWVDRDNLLQERGHDA